MTPKFGQNARKSSTIPKNLTDESVPGEHLWAVRALLVLDAVVHALDVELHRAGVARGEVAVGTPKTRTRVNIDNEN